MRSPLTPAIHSICVFTSLHGVPPTQTQTQTQTQTVPLGLKADADHCDYDKWLRSPSRLKSALRLQVEVVVKIAFKVVVKARIARVTIEITSRSDSTS